MPKRGADDADPAATAGATRSLSLSPQLCVCVLSMRRLDLLRVTLRAITEHLESVETGATPENKPWTQASRR